MLRFLLLLMALLTAIPTPAQRPYQPFGAARELLYARDPVVFLSGPAGTGKSRGALEKLHICAMKYEGMRGLILRKTRKSITQSAMVTFEQKVLPMGSKIRFHTGDQGYRYPNGSLLAVAGIDNPGKVMSSEWDIVYIQEGTELFEPDLEALDTRMRNGIMPYQQIIGDCNPAAPTHWLKKRADRGDIRLLESRHEDNPQLWDRAGKCWTPAGSAYLARLARLTGARKDRLLRGIWAAAEGMVYEMWDPAKHIIDAKSRPDLYDRTGDIPIIKIPKEWPRYRVIDFGYTHAFVCQWWTLDPDGRLILYRELYGTQRIVEDWAKEIKELSEGETILATIADHDADDRETLRRHGVPTIKAKKQVSPGLQAVAARLRLAGDSRPRIYFMADALVRRDRLLDESRAPASTTEEFDGYVWAKSAGGLILKEVPIKEGDHGMDAMRYMVAHLDFKKRDDNQQKGGNLSDWLS